MWWVVPAIYRAVFFRSFKIDVLAFTQSFKEGEMLELKMFLLPCYSLVTYTGTQQSTSNKLASRTQVVVDSGSLLLLEYDYFLVRNLQPELPLILCNWNGILTTTVKCSEVLLKTRTTNHEN